MLLFLWLLTSHLTAHCFHPCNDYFEHLPKEGPINLYKDNTTPLVAIADNDAARQIQVFVPSQLPEKMSIKPNGQVERTRTYEPSRTKAKQVNFSDLQNNYPIIKHFDQEPRVPERNCELEAIHEAMEIQVEK